MKILIILAIFVGSALCSLEPAGHLPSSTYLPPNSRRHSSSMSSTYLPPNRRHQNTHSRLQSNYQQQSSYYQRSQNTYQASNYDPSHEYNTMSSSTYLSPRRSYLSSAAPSNRYIPSSFKDTYSLPEVAGVRISNIPATSYGVPEYNDVYSKGHHRYNHKDDYSNEPAKYNFAYQVNDNHGNDYSHRESRNGAKTHGSYSVLLPDGRKQIVEYEADEAGYRPKISYVNIQTDRAAYTSEGPY